MLKIFSPKKIVIVLLCSLLVLLFKESSTNTGGAPGGYTNAPNEANCTSCHGGTLQTSGTNYNNISLSNNLTGGGYIPDSTYTFTLNYTHSGKSKFGYQLTCLDKSNQMAGSFSLLSGNNKSSITSTNISGATRSYMRQTSAGSSGSGGASWSFQWKAPASIKDTLTFYVVVNATNSSSSNTGDIIIAKEFFIIPSSLLPEANASINNSNVCQANSIQLQGSGTNSPVSYAWKLPNGTPSISNAQNPNVVYNFPGKYNAILTVTNAKGKSKPDTVTINVLKSPGPFIPNGNSRKICQGDSILLKLNPVETGVSYTWNTGQKGDSLWVSQNGPYYVTGLGKNGCSRNSNTIQVSFFDKPTSNLRTEIQLSNDSICQNTLVRLVSDSLNNDSFYFYASGSLVQRTTDAFHDILVNQTTTYGVQVRDQNLCLSDTAYYTLFAQEKRPAPRISCSNSTVDSIIYTWTNPSIHNGYQISINQGKSWSTSTSGLNGTRHEIGGLQPDDSITLWVRGIDNGPCLFSLIGTKTCYTKSCSPLQVNVNADTSICDSNLWQIEINGLSNQKYSLTIDNGDAFTDTLFSFNPKVSRDYIIEIIDSNHLTCPSKKIALPLQIDQKPTATLSPIKSKAFCEGETIQFEANNLMDNWTFVLNTIPVQSGNSNKYTNNTLSDGDSLYVIVNKGKCRDTSSIVSVNIESTIDASFDFVREQSIYTFTPSNLLHNSYSWNFGDGSAISNDVSPRHDFITSEGKETFVRLAVVTSNDCLADSGQLIRLPLFSHVDELKKDGIDVFPNPTQNLLVINQEIDTDLVAELRSIDGILVQRVLIKDANHTIDLSHLKTGIYTLTLISRDKQWNTRIFRN